MLETRKLVYFDSDLCMGCRACEVACKVEHNLPVGVTRLRIIEGEPVMVNGKLKLDFQRISCRQCPDHPCLEACPSEAIYEREDGIITVNVAECTGCESCADSCPYDVICHHPETLVPEFCDLCFHRIERGLTPFCVQHCMTGALYFGPQDEFETLKEKPAAQKGVKDEENCGSGQSN